MNGYPCFMDISLQLSVLLWISLDFYGYPYIDLLWIFDPGAAFDFSSSMFELFLTASRYKLVKYSII